MCRPPRCRPTIRATGTVERRATRPRCARPATSASTGRSSPTEPTDVAAAPLLSAHLPVRPDWLALNREPILEPELPIVDPHHHLIDRPATSGVYLLPDLLADTGTGHNITATV